MATSYPRVCIIGNNASNGSVSDGGRIKIRLYRDLLVRNGVDTFIVDLDGWKKRILKVLFQIKKAIKHKDAILIMAGPNGSRKLIPLVNKLNKKKQSRVVYCPLGVGTFEGLFKNLKPEQVTAFLNNEDYFGITDDKINRELEKLDLIMPQNKVIADCYKGFYKLDNVVILNNFRDIVPERKQYKVSDNLSIIFLSRICEEKGIFDIIDSVNHLNYAQKRFTLDIYGDLQLSDSQKERFFNSLNSEVKYMGVLNQNQSIATIKGYDLFILPTKYKGEGTSGSLIEAFLSGTPALVSSYSQAKMLINDNVDGFIFKLGDQEDLEKKLIAIYDNKSFLESIGVNAQQKSLIYTFEYNKELFIKYIVGETK